MQSLEEVNENEFDDSIRDKIRYGSNSGYLDEQYQTTKEFPLLHDYYFRIQDEGQIMELKQLQQQSQPIQIQSTFNSSSDSFKGRLDQLINQLDQHQVCFPNQHPIQHHSFYQLADHYNDDSAIQSVLQKANIQELRHNVENMSIKDLKPVFMKRPPKKQESQSMVAEQDVKKLNKKMNRLTITEDDL